MPAGSATSRPAEIAAAAGWRRAPFAFPLPSRATIAPDEPTRPSTLATFTGSAAPRPWRDPCSARGDEFLHAAHAGGATLGAASCGGGSGRSVPVDDFEGDLLSAECDFLIICGAVPDRATCLASVRLDSARFATLKTDIAAGTVAYDGQAAGACVDVFKNLMSCKQTVMGDVQQRLDATCGKVFTGSLPAGGACFFDEECANRGLCRNETCSSNGCCAGTCLARPTPIPLGGDCSNPLPDQYCIEGTVCAANAAGGGTCKAPLAAGARVRSVRPLRLALPLWRQRRSRHQRRNLHGASRARTGLRYGGGVRRRPRLLRPELRVHQPDRPGRRLLSGRKSASITQPARERASRNRDLTTTVVRTRPTGACSS